jgi:hypothetical protein
MLVGPVTALRMAKHSLDPLGLTMVFWGPCTAQYICTLKGIATIMKSPSIK